MQDYGPARPFQDDSLFTLIERVTNAKVREYCDRYIKGTERPPIKDILSLIGWDYTAEKVSKAPGFGFKGDFRMVEGKPGLYLSISDPANPMKVVDGDRVVKIEGMTMQEAFQSEAGRAALEKFRVAKVGDTLSMVVLRDGQEVELSGKAEMVNKTERHFIEINPTPTPAQTALKRAVYYE
jgi:predicted metalloprotease with PDZ domain